MAAVLASRNDGMWVAPPGREATQVLPGHEVYFISAVFEDHCLFEMCRHLPLQRRRLARRGQLYTKDPSARLAHGCGRLRMSFRIFKLCHRKAGNELLACRNYEEINVMELYYG